MTVWQDLHVERRKHLAHEASETRAGVLLMKRALEQVNCQLG